MVEKPTPAEAKQTAVEGVPVCLDASLAVLIRSCIPHKLYMRLAIASGSEHMKAHAVPELARVGVSAGHILPPAEMERDE